MYKVRIGRGWQYFADEESAKEKGEPQRVEIYRHHTAVARGYVGVNGEHIEWYKGKFGTGYVMHYSSKYSKRGNGHHLIEYMIEATKE